MNRNQLDALFRRLRLAAEMDSEITLKPDEADAVYKWIASERYRHRTFRYYRPPGPGYGDE